ncbi:EF-hand domain-containing family member C2 [Saimiri boliviensis]|uniref:EF-hand domain-containing family member C2 n=1 Tax=Saimiri boliviensis boliviensis TaxID=39432 RepID=A0A2K6T5V8_SAIBB|nr:EF-hand domain-containing family member C2 [Saimiri boliviensis boliviensis]XP_010348439.1 EF-hand domain-containing family member C2 [Saimiri boliviensis boliviensis]
MPLPLLPGNSFNRNVGKEKFHKSQHWGFCNNVMMLVSEEKPGIGGEPLLGQKIKPKSTIYPQGDGSDLPSWVAFDKQVLSFDAYLEEEVPDKSQTKYRIRYYKIYYYPEDDTIQVNEPEVKNSGLPQGTSIRRHRITLPPPDEDQFYTVYHFNVGTEVVFYGRIFKIYDCDTFTRNFLRKLGVKVNPPVQCPEDPYTKIRREILEHVEPLRPYESFDTRKQFLQYHGKVLRFFCLWDDSVSMLGDRRELILHYFLCDDTIEIKELLPDNSGRDPTKMFLRRSKLPKDGHTRVYQPGQITDRTVLNLYGDLKRNQEDGYLLDKHKLGKVDQEFYKDCDLSLGVTINVWGRKVLLYDCDEFTKSYYKSKYGIENFTSVSCKPPSPPPKIERKFPPYNGFGSEEDSLRNCLGLKPTPHRKNFKKFMEKDRYGLESNILRFFAKLDTEKYVDLDRIFVISYYLADDTISVFEPIENNSGVTGGMFLKRSRVKKPGQPVFKSELSEYFKAEEFYIGVTVNVNGYVFHLLNADEYTLKYMEQNVDKYPFSDFERSLQKVKQEESRSRELKQVFRAADCKHTKMVDYNTFRDIVMTFTHGNLSEQEFITIARHYRVPEEICPDGDFLLGLAQEKFKKNFFENFDRIIYACGYEDREKKNVLPTKDIKRLCKSFRLPLTDDLLESLLSRFENSEKQIDYKSFFSTLDWRKNPVPELHAQEYLKQRCEDVWLGMPSPIPAKNIDYFTFLKDTVGLEEE